jgi:hypothetical protein
MRFESTRTKTFAWALGLSILHAAAGHSQAQAIVAPAPDGAPQHHGHDHGWGFHWRRNPIPRTYSYYYDTWFNQPRHFRVVGPDGKTYWRTTVRGLPMGTPWLGP